MKFKKMNSAKYQEALELTKSLMEKYSNKKVILLKLEIIQCSIYNWKLFREFRNY